MKIHDRQLYTATWATAGVFSFSAVLISGFLIYQHLRRYSTPALQRHIVRILLMVPIYAIDSWLSLKFPHLALYLDTIYEFIVLLIYYLGGEKQLEATLLEKRKTMKQPWPCCCLPALQSNRRFLLHCKYGTLQFAVIKPCIAALACLCEFFGVYDEGNFAINRAYGYLSFVDNISVTLALWYLVLFYMMLAEELKGFKPVLKFLCIKAVIFATFWQGVMVSMFVSWGWIKAVGEFTVDDVSTGLQDLLICIEMFFAAVAHIYAFSARDFSYHGMRSSVWRSFLNVLNFKEILSDTKEMLSTSKSSSSREERSVNVLAILAEEERIAAEEISAKLSSLALRSSSPSSPIELSSLPVGSTPGGLGEDVV